MALSACWRNNNADLHRHYVIGAGNRMPVIVIEISQIQSVTQFLGAFGLLIGMYVLGLVNELA